LEALLYVEEHGELELAGGVFELDGESRLGGNGTVILSGGLHSLPDVIVPNVEIVGGTMEVRGRQLTMKGDVAIHNGTMRFTVTSTVAAIANGTLTIAEGELSFPEVLPNAAIHPAHLHTQVRNADRSRLVLLGPLVWRGGRIRGNVDVESRVSTFLDGGPKHLEALAHVINYENLLWGTGDVITKEQGVLTNLGTTQMESPASFSASIVYGNTNDGCCPHDDFELRTWEDNMLYDKDSAYVYGIPLLPSTTQSEDAPHPEDSINFPL